MKDITKVLIEEYRLEESGVDFMGYELKRPSYHHLIIPRRMGGKESIENGAILDSKTSHPYLHIVEGRDYEKFLDITSEIVDEKVKGYIDKENIERIDDILKCFEREHSGDTTSKGRPIIKEIFVEGRKNMDIKELRLGSTSKLIEKMCIVRNQEEMNMLAFELTCRMYVPFKGIEFDELLRKNGYVEKEKDKTLQRVRKDV